MILAVDIGGTSAKLALVDRRGVLGPRCSADTAFDGYRTPMLDTVIRATRSFLEREGAQVEGIGVSATGQIDTAQGIVIGTNGKIPNYEGAQIRRNMEAAFGVPVRVLNDANAAALGECFVGRARGLRHVVMATYGTGVGGGIVTDGRVFGGTRGIAGEIGLIPMGAAHAGSPCSRYEDRASTSALVRAAEHATGEAKLDGRRIFARLASGDPVLRQVADAWLDDVAAGLIGLVHVFNPQMVVLGGGVSAQEALFIEPVRRRVLEGVQPRFAEGLRVERAALGNDAGLIGAAKFFMDETQAQ